MKVGTGNCLTVILILFDLAAPRESDLQPTQARRLNHVVAVNESVGVKVSEFADAISLKPETSSVVDNCHL